MKKLAIIYTGQPRLLPELLPYHEFLAKVLKKEICKFIVGDEEHARINDLEIDIHYCLWDYNTLPGKPSIAYHEKTFINKDETANQILSYYERSEDVHNTTVRFYSHDLLESITDEFSEICKQNTMSISRDALIREFAMGVSQLLIRKIAVDNIVEDYDAVLFSRTDSIIKIRDYINNPRYFQRIIADIISVFDNRDKTLTRVKNIFGKNIDIFEDRVVIGDFYSSIKDGKITHDHQIVSSARGFKEMFSDFKNKLFNFLLNEIKVYHEICASFEKNVKYNVFLPHAFNPQRLFVSWFFDCTDNIKYINITDGMILLTLKTNNELRHAFKLTRNRNELESNPIPKEY